MDILPIVAMTMLTKKLTDFAKGLMPPSMATTTIIPLAMGIGIAITLMAYLSPQVASAVTLWGNVTLADTDLFAAILYGAVLGAGAGVIHDLTGDGKPNPKGGDH